MKRTKQIDEKISQVEELKNFFEDLKDNKQAAWDNRSERWHLLYGKLPVIEKPKWKTVYGSKSFEGKVYFKTIEQYCQFLADNYGWTTPDVRIHFADGTKKEIFKTELVPA